MDFNDFHNMPSYETANDRTCILGKFNWNQLTRMSFTY